MAVGKRGRRGPNHTQEFRKEVADYVEKHGYDEAVKHFQRFSKEALGNIVVKYHKIIRKGTLSHKPTPIKYEAMKIEPKAPEPQKIFMICSDDPNQILNVLKGLL